MSTMVIRSTSENVTQDPAWLIREEGFDPAREHDIESLLTTGNGYLGTRGSVSEISAVSRPATFIAGVFDPPSGGEGIPDLVVGPDWLSVRIYIEGDSLEMTNGECLEHVRTLDMRQGSLHREWRQVDRSGRITRISAIRFASFEDRHTMAIRLTITPENYSGRIRVEAAIDGRVTNSGGAAHLTPVQSRAIHPHGALYATCTNKSGITIAVAQIADFCCDASSRSFEEACTLLEEPHQVGECWDIDAVIGREYTLTKHVSIFTSRDSNDPVDAAIENVQRNSKRGFTDLFRKHVAALERRWQTTDIEIVGDEKANRAVRFAIYHMLIAANPDDELVSIGARTLSGEAYKGHVFWDTETFMLPLFTYTHPETARALLRYRFHTINGARRKAAKAGYKGALYAWESAETGDETTPPFVINPEGLVVPVLSGIEQHHISADVPYAIWQYVEVTGDESLLLEGGAEIILDTSRFWASRVELGPDDLYHITTIMGPDEYHESIDDSVYNNTMSRWTLRYGLQIDEWLKQNHPDYRSSLLERLSIDDEQLHNWCEIADKIFLSYDPTTRLIEEFKGYFGLEYIDLKAYEPRTAPMDLLLGREKTQASQVVKQADVVLLFHLLPDDYTFDVKRINYDFYEQRTGHGSSLSPSIHCAVAARLREFRHAERYFKMSSEIDLQNNMGNAAGGIHAAACGGLWQAIVFGFAGLGGTREGLSLDPWIPKQWSKVRFAVIWHGSILRLELAPEPAAIELSVEQGGGAVPVKLPDSEWKRLEPGRSYRAVFKNDEWQFADEV